MTSQAQTLLCPRDGSELEIRRWKSCPGQPLADPRIFEREDV